MTTINEQWAASISSLFVLSLTFTCWTFALQHFQNWYLFILRNLAPCDNFTRLDHRKFILRTNRSGIGCSQIYSNIDLLSNNVLGQYGTTQVDSLDNTIYASLDSKPTRLAVLRIRAGHLLVHELVHLSWKCWLRRSRHLDLVLIISSYSKIPAMNWPELTGTYLRMIKECFDGLYLCCNTQK